KKAAFPNPIRTRCDQDIDVVHRSVVLCRQALKSDTVKDRAIHAGERMRCNAQPPGHELLIVVNYLPKLGLADFLVGSHRVTSRNKENGDLINQLRATTDLRNSRVCQASD